MSTVYNTDELNSLHIALIAKYCAFCIQCGQKLRKIRKKGVFLSLKLGKKGVFILKIAQIVLLLILDSVVGTRLDEHEA